MFKSDQTLDFHNKQIADIALGQRCKNPSCAYILTSPLGHVYTNVCNDGMHCVKLYGDADYDKIDWDVKVDFIRASSLLPSNKHAKHLRQWLRAYFTSPLKCKDMELSFCGLDEFGEFNSKIWMTILDTCPVGELMSYSELAIRSGNSAGASKVVGYAINKNPYMLVVGDHRVVKATGVIWTCDNSQRNKLRRLLIDYEMEQAGTTVEDALLVVKERNAKTKSSRTRNTTNERKRKKPAGKNAKKLKKGRKDDSDFDDTDDDDNYETD